MTDTSQTISPNIDTDDFVAVGIVPNDPEMPPASEQIRYDQFVRQLFKADTERIEALHIGLGIGGEVGELIEAIRLKEFKAREEELGDLEFYLQAARTHYQVSHKGLLNYELGTEYLKLSLEDLFTIASGDVQDCIKREYVYNKPRDAGLVYKALALFSQGLELYYDIYGFARREILQANADKLAKRYVSLRYSDAAAIERADKKTGPQET